MESFRKFNRIIYFLFLLILGFCVLSVYKSTTDITTYAYDNNYLRIIDDITPFYSKPDDKAPLFYLPYTYYVKVLNYQNDYVHAEIGYGKTSLLDGYIPADKLFEDNLTVSMPYPDITISILQTTPFYTDYNRSQISQYIFDNRQVQFYGSVETQDHDVLYFVSYNNKLGYISQEDVYPFLVPNHPNELTFIQKTVEELPQETHEDQITEDNLLSLKWVIIICIGFAGIIGMIYALKRKPYKPDKYSYYNENRTD